MHRTVKQVKNVTRQSSILVPKASFIHFIYQLLTKDQDGITFDRLFKLIYKINESALLLRGNRFFSTSYLMLTLHLAVCMCPQKHIYRRHYFVISPSETAKLVHCKSPLGTPGPGRLGALYWVFSSPGESETDIWYLPAYCEKETKPPSHQSACQT